MPILPKITQLIGISDADLAGKTIDDAAVARIAADAVVVIDLDEAQIEIEHGYLIEQIHRRPVSMLPADRFTARDRFSARTIPDLGV